MAHDFMIATKGENRKHAFFFGYAEGIFYSAFDKNEANGGVSGMGISYEISHSEAEQGLKEVIEKFDQMNYPDPTRADSIKDFYKNHVLENPEEIYVLDYS